MSALVIVGGGGDDDDDDYDADAAAADDDDDEEGKEHTHMHNQVATGTQTHRFMQTYIQTYIHPYIGQSGSIRRSAVANGVCQVVQVRVLMLIGRLWLCCWLCCRCRDVVIGCVAGLLTMWSVSSC